MTEILQADGALFLEEQRFRQRWLWALILLAATVPVWTGLPVFRGVPHHPPSIEGWLAFTAGITAVVALLAFARLQVRVTPAELEIIYRPFFVHRRIEIGEIATYGARRYNPALAGYGIHFTTYGWVYNVSGREGVALQLASGKRLLIGTQRPQELAAALAQAGARQS